MTAIVGERDNLIMNTVPRYAAPIDRALRITASSTTFEVSLTGQPAPATITFSALMLGAVGEIMFSSEPPVALAVTNGDAVLKFEDMTSSIVTVTATTVIDGLTYFDRQTVDKRQALDLRPPPAPTGLATTGQPAAIRLNWAAAPANYANLDYTEIWRAPVNDIAQAAPVARADAREFTDPVGPGKTLYYWIRYVSRASIPGPFNNSTGTVGASAIEVEHLLQVLTGQITESQLYADLGAKIDKIEQLEDVFGDAVSAAQSAAAAELARAAADQAAGLAVQYRDASAQSAISAETDAAKATSQAAESAQSSTNAGTSAAAASRSKDLAVQAANGAGQSAVGAAQSSSSASGFANAAGQSATAASGSATMANTNAGQAGTYAGQAASSATAANGSATAAASFLQQAQAILNDPITGLVDKYAAVKVLADATASALDGARARYAVQLDADGVAGGFELIGGGGRIDFGVRATSFFIAGPSGGPVAPSVPFIVRTTETVIDGVTIPIGTYIANAFIQNASITNAKIAGDIWSSNWAPGANGSGWYLQRSGDFYANSVRLRGNIAGGAYTGYSWPANNGTGYYLGPEGLLLGNPSTGRYLQVEGDGTLHAPGFSIENGRANFSGNVNTGIGAGFRIEMGPDDPVYAMWAGAGTKNDTNAIFYLKRSGAGYFGGALSAGTLRTAVTNPSISANVELVDGPFGTNGGAIAVVCSYNYLEFRGRDGGSYSVSGPESSATVRLYRTIGTAAETLVQTFIITGSTTVTNSGIASELSFYQREMGGSFTYTDNAGSSENRTYRAVLSDRNLKTVTFNPVSGGLGASVSTLNQTLTIVTTE
ncbi:UNVERIFIED_ORG: hypothetical protein JN05_01292 [Zoogloea ramigera]|uniref:Tip attachment protein J central straight fiber domain-containing protein n=1 Tax=Duganella zoogloeoides TaxID=75659 RepID=A0ABZ0Y4C2_9BURK|nr:hypothetical protein [Duganella zoogloeoides]WQH06898.1 hypothetical protein SR858_11370 [Duganella zoogloeoides]